MPIFRIKQYFSMLFLLLFCAVVIAQDSNVKPKNTFTEKYRPQFHYTTVKGWINVNIKSLRVSKLKSLW
jgi:hypothetical protein